MCLCVFQVSEDMLRLVVNEAQKSEGGIQNDKGKMITGVLDLHSIPVSKVMQPRVDIVAVPADAHIQQIVHTARSSRYSRIPVYSKHGVDHIVGVIICKDLLRYIASNSISAGDLVAQSTAGAVYETEPAHVSGHVDSEVSHDEATPTLITTANDEAPLDADRPHAMQPLPAEDLRESTYFIPETMTLWAAMHELRKRRLQMAIVVDEYGGTAGLVTFEDILEQIVGDIYDEDELQEHLDDSRKYLKKISRTKELIKCSSLLQYIWMQEPFPRMPRTECTRSGDTRHLKMSVPSLIGSWMTQLKKSLRQYPDFSAPVLVISRSPEKLST
jgi:CBS domain containing-hemolysin-like protein